MIRVLLVDDFPIVRQGLSQLINHEADMTVCGEASDGTEAIARVTALQPDIAIVDLSLPGPQNGFDIAKTISHTLSDTHVLVLSMHDESIHAERALRAGARGYLMKSEPPDMILNAIRQVMQGELYVSKNFSDQMMEAVTNSMQTDTTIPENTLSDRERDVFELIGTGLSSIQIAEQLELSSKTVESHKSHIRQKLDVSSAALLQERASQWLARDLHCAPPV